MSAPTRKLAAILAADVAGYSKLMGEDEAGTLDALRELRQDLFQPTVSEHHGVVVKSMGDGWLVEFASVVDAVTCALQVQQNLANHEIIKLRIGIHIGDIVHEDEDIYGDGVNIAARLQEISEPGGIALSDTARKFLDGKLAGEFRDAGEKQLKNISEAVRVFVSGDGETKTTKALNIDAPLSLPDKPSIAVLPFDNMSGDPEQEYFSDGISEDIITDLSKVSGLFVIARNSAFVYKDKAFNVPDICRELGVRFVLEGSVRKAGDRVRITAQLIDGESGGHLWAERYDRVLQDIFAVQDEITQKIVEALKIKLDLSESARIGVQTTASIEAYDTALRARSLLLTFTPEGTAEAAKLYEQAIALDPEFITAITGLAGTQFNSSLSGWSDDPTAALERGCDLARRAVALDPNGLQANWALALAHLWQHDLDGAIEAINRAVRLGPSDAEAYATRGYILSYAARPQEAIESLEKSMRLDPQYPNIWLHFLAHAYFVGGNYGDAAAILRRRIRRHPETDISRVLLASCYGHLGLIDEARAAWAEALRANPAYSVEHKGQQLPYKDPADWDRVVEGLRKADLDLGPA